jgi:hypothetical protein
VGLVAEAHIEFIETVGELELGVLTHIIKTGLDPRFDQIQSRFHFGCKCVLDALGCETALDLDIQELG